MLTENSKKIVLKLGSSTVVDRKGAFKKKWVTSLIKDIKKFGKNLTAIHIKAISPISSNIVTSLV